MIKPKLIEREIYWYVYVGLDLYKEQFLILLLLLRKRRKIIRRGVYMSNQYASIK